MTTNKTHRALFTCSLFLHVGYIGIVTVAVGLIQLLAGEASVLSALALIVFGGLLAMASWRRARKSIELEHRVPAVAPHLQGTIWHDRSLISQQIDPPLTQNWANGRKGHCGLAP
jgi:hypothetical protein